MAENLRVSPGSAMLKHFQTKVKDTNIPRAEKKENDGLGKKGNSSSRDILRIHTYLLTFPLPLPVKDCIQLCVACVVQRSRGRKHG